MNTNPTINPSRLQPASILAMHTLEKAIAGHFRAMRAETVRMLAKILHVAKAADDERDALDAIMDELRDTWEAIARQAEKLLTGAALAGAAKGGLELTIMDADALNLINTTAQEWAYDRAAELVGMRRLKDGTFVENPSARWAISESTRNKLRICITDIFEQDEPRTLRGLENRIQDAGLFTDTRASMIARTEISFAQTQGNVTAWRESGLVRTVDWVLASDHVKDDVCDTNAEAGPYELADVPTLPAYPFCYCALVLSELVSQG